MVERYADYWRQQLKQRLDRIEHSIPRFEEPVRRSAVLYKAVVSTNGLEKEIAWNMTQCEAGLFVRHLQHSTEVKHVGVDGNASSELIPEYRIEKQETL